MQLRPLFPVLGSTVRNRPRLGAALGLVGAAAMLGGATKETADIKVSISNVRNTKGVVHACLTPDKKDFPNCKKQPKHHQLTVSAKKSLTITFKGVKPGKYAIALMHDENKNGKIDRPVLIPTEGFGFSRNAKVRMGPPSFKAAAFDVKAGENSHAIKMRYIL